MNIIGLKKYIIQKMDTFLLGSATGKESGLAFPVGHYILETIVEAIR